MNANRLASKWFSDLHRIQANDPDFQHLERKRGDVSTQNMTDDEWEQLGHDISSNTHLREVTFSSFGLDHGILNDQKMACLFRGLTRSSSINDLDLYENRLSAAGISSMVPFLQNANNLTKLNLNFNNLQSEGFNMLLRALSNSPIEGLYCLGCGIQSIEIDSENIPRNLKILVLSENNVDADGCRGLATLLQADSTLTTLYLRENKIDDEGVEILVDALQNNTSLEDLDLRQNDDGISKRGQISLLKLVNDVSSIRATLQSNHTLRCIRLNDLSNANEHIQRHIDAATNINRTKDNPEAAGRAKVHETQLHGEKRAELAALHGVSQSIYNEINPLHLPEVFALVARPYFYNDCWHHGQGELYVALKLSIAGLISTVDRKQCLKQQRADLKVRSEEIKADLEARLEAIKAEIAAIDAKIVTIEAAEGREVDVRSEARSNKRRRS